jgi:RsiW-degrading membrane proteinase PrsW (M82 family)
VKPKYSFRVFMLGSSIWIAAITWMAFFTRNCDGAQYLTAMIITAISGFFVVMSMSKVPK